MPDDDQVTINRPLDLTAESLRSLLGSKATPTFPLTTSLYGELTVTFVRELEQNIFGALVVVPEDPATINADLLDWLELAQRDQAMLLARVDFNNNTVLLSTFKNPAQS